MWNTYVAIGDSLAEGWGEQVSGYSNKGWVTLFSQELEKKNPNLNYFNYGWRGSTVSEVINTQVKPALKHNPDLLTIIVGANDIRAPVWDPTEFEEQYEELIQSVTANHRTIIPMTYPLISSLGTEIRNGKDNFWKIFTKRIRQVNEIIRNLSAEENLFVINMENFELFGDRENLSNDLVHPNSRGYWFVAKHCIDTVQKQFNW